MFNVTNLLDWLSDLIEDTRIYNLSSRAWFIKRTLKMVYINTSKTTEKKARKNLFVEIKYIVYY